MITARKPRIVRRVLGKNLVVKRERSCRAQILPQHHAEWIVRIFCNSTMASSIRSRTAKSTPAYVNANAGPPSNGLTSAHIASICATVAPSSTAIFRRAQCARSFWAREHVVIGDSLWALQDLNLLISVRNALALQLLLPRATAPLTLRGPCSPAVCSSHHLWALQDLNL